MVAPNFGFREQVYFLGVEASAVFFKPPNMALFGAGSFVGARTSDGSSFHFSVREC